MIALMPNESSMHRDPDTIAVRLVALLPRRASSNNVPLKTLIGAGKMSDSWIVIVVILTALALGAECVVASHQAFGQADKAQTQVSGTPPLESVPISDR